jgi:hypothetical protein
MVGAAYQALEPEQPQAMRALPCVPCRLTPREAPVPPKEPALSAASGANRGGDAQESTA